MGFKEDIMDDEHDKTRDLTHVSEMKHSRHKTTEMKNKTAIVTNPADQKKQQSCNTTSRHKPQTADIKHNQQA